MFDRARNNIDIYIDASLSGMGAFWCYVVYAVSRYVMATQGLNITQLEILNVLVALRTFGETWSKQCIKFFIDNKAVVFSLKKGRIKDTSMQAVARSICFLAAIYDIKLDFCHIAGIHNI